MHGMSEEAWELAAIERLAETDFWQPLTGHDIAPGSGLRDTWADPVVRPWVMDALVRLNKDVPTQHLQQALADILATTSQDAITENHRVHDLMVNGYRGLTYTDGDGREVNPTIWLLSPNADENVYHAVRQVTVRAGDHERRFDVVLYVNGLPLVIIELKKAGCEKADVAAAHAQLATYVRELPMAFRFCVAHRRQRRVAREVRHSLHPAQPLLPRGTSTTAEARSRHTTPTSREPPDRAGSPHRRPLQRRALPADRASTTSPSTRPTPGWSSGSPSRTSTSRSTKAVGSTDRRGPQQRQGRASSGTPRARASPWRWSSTPPR
jgi:hypothetical protein